MGFPDNAAFDGREPRYNWSQSGPLASGKSLDFLGDHIS